MWYEAIRKSNGAPVFIKANSMSEATYKFYVQFEGESAANSRRRIVDDQFFIYEKGRAAVVSGEHAYVHYQAKVDFAGNLIPAKDQNKVERGFGYRIAIDADDD